MIWYGLLGCDVISCFFFFVFCIDCIFLNVLVVQTEYFLERGRVASLEASSEAFEAVEAMCWAGHLVVGAVGVLREVLPTV